MKKKKLVEERMIEKKTCNEVLSEKKALRN